MTRIALIPAYEPDEVLTALAEELCASGFDVVVVDDGSGPAYEPIFRKLKSYTEVISYEENRGKGYALKQGLQYIKENFGDAVIVTVDADGQHLLSDTIRVCAEAESGTADLVIGSRTMTRDSPVKSRLGNGLTRWVYSMTTGIRVYDTQSGLRAFNSRLIPTMLEIPGERYEYEMNVLLYMSGKKKRIKEIPIETIYFDKQNSVSHFNAVSDSLKIYGEITKFAGSSLISFAIDYTLYSLFLMIPGTSGRGPVAANFGARAISSVCNFFLNKKLVFKTNSDISIEAAKYFGLVLFNICVNSLILTSLTQLGLNAYFAKVIVEIIMFFFSYAIQHFMIFRKK